MAREEAAKGVTMPDSTYRWQCGHCGGAGLENGETCSWCYGLDTEQILNAMNNGVRGARYYSLLKAFLSVHGKAITDHARKLRAERGGSLTLVELGAIQLRFGLNFKATVEWLEETRVIHSGTYDRIHDSGWKVKDIQAAARAQYPDS